MIPIRWHLQNEVCEAYSVRRQSSSALHGHYCFLITLIISGRGVQTLNGIDIPFSKGQVFILSPADFHKNTLLPGESYDYYGVKFPYELLDKHLSGLCALNKLPLAIKLSNKSFDLAKEIFERLIEECNSDNKKIASDIYIETMIEQLIIISLRESADGAYANQSAFLNRSLGYLYSHFNENISISDAAEYMGYTPNYFNTVFRESMGAPFGQYLRDLRLSYASNLLRSCDMSITEVALESGFESLAHFSRSFHEKYGSSPKEYRRKCTPKEDCP